MNTIALSHSDVLAEIDALQNRALRALDQRDWPGWLHSFAPEASYLCLSRENEEQGLSMPLMMDDCRERLEDRVKFITEVWAGTFEDYATRHFVQRLSVEEVAQNVYAAESNLLVAYTTSRGRSDVLVTGLYRDRITTVNGYAQFLVKEAVLDTVTTPRYLVYPV